MSTTKTSTATHRGVWLALILLTAFVCGIAAGALFGLLGVPAAGAIGAGGAVFTSVTALGFAAYSFVVGAK